MYQFDEIDNLQQLLLKPFYILNMARGNLTYTSAINKSAQTRAANAKRDIRTIVEKWVKENGSTLYER